MIEQGQQLPYSPNEIEAMLALATTGGEPASGSPNTDFSQLTASELVTAIHAVHEVKIRLQQEHQWNLGHPVEPVAVSEVDRRLATYDVDGLLEEMPRLVGIDKTRDVFTLLAGGSVDGRHEAAAYIGTLTEVDHDYGLDLWKRLLEDDDHKVAAHAWEVASDYFYDTPPERLREGLAREGLTWEDFQALMRIYVKRLEDFRDPDALAS